MPDRLTQADPFSTTIFGMDDYAFGLRNLERDANNAFEGNITWERVLLNPEEDASIGLASETPGLIDDYGVMPQTVSHEKAMSFAHTVITAVTIQNGRNFSGKSINYIKGLVTKVELVNEDPIRGPWYQLYITPLNVPGHTEIVDLNTLKGIHRFIPLIGKVN